MVIRDLDVPGSSLAPSEADAILLVDSNAVLPLSISLQGLEAVPWWDSQIFERFRVVNQEELLSSAVEQIRRTDPPAVLKPAIGIDGVLSARPSAPQSAVSF
jgi:hypothetical protein